MLFREIKNILYYFVYLLIILSIFLLSCTSNKEKIEKKQQSLKVYTSLFVFEHFAKVIIPEAEVESLIPKGIDPHHFEPALKDIQKLHDAKMIIYIGDTDIDRWIDKVKDELIKKGIKIVRLEDSLTLKRYYFSKEIDPHIWLDPLLSREIINIIKEKAIEVSPEKREIIEKNLAVYEQKLKELDSMYKNTLANCTLKDVISTHEFLNYLSTRYGFNSHFIVHEPEEDLSPTKIKKLKDFIKKNSIEYIVSEPEGEKIARTLSQETGIKILNFNTYHSKSEKDYINVMQENLKVLAVALKCKI